VAKSQLRHRRAGGGTAGGVSALRTGVTGCDARLPGMSSAEIQPEEIQRRVLQQGNDVAALYDLLEGVDYKIDTLDAKVGAGFARLDAKIDAKVARLDAKIDTKVAGLDAKIDALDAKVDGLDARLNAKIDTLDARLSGKLDAILQRLGG
jgi:hypothetical protein